MRKYLKRFLLISLLSGVVAGLVCLGSTYSDKLPFLGPEQVAKAREKPKPPKANPAPKPKVERATSKPLFLYEAMIFEIVPIKDCNPDPDALTHFRAKLEEYGICRSEGVFFLVSPELPAPGVPWSTPSIEWFETMTRGLQDQDKQDKVAVVYVSYLNGSVVRKGGKVVRLGGMQYSDTSFTVFKGGAKNREAGVLLHELGHMIGLRKDQKTAPRHHCPRMDCVMYPSVGSPYANFCVECQEKLAALIKAKRGA